MRRLVEELVSQKKMLRYGAGSMYVEVEIADVRMVYGKVQCQVVPVSGRGDLWVNLESLVEKN